MKVTIDEAKTMLKSVYTKLGVAPDSVDWLVELSIEQDLEGNFFSGFGETPEGIPAELKPDKVETLEVDRPAVKLVNGNGKAAKLVMKDLMPKAVGWARDQGMVCVGLKNCGYQAALSTIARKFAEQDLICIYSGNGGPQGVVPYGGTKDILGTSPVAYGIPTSDLPIVFDAATAERAYGTIAKARERKEQLPENTYFDKTGHYTTDPEAAIALITFGGYKGYAFNLLFEILTGALVGAQSGTLMHEDTDLGGVLILIDPTAFGPIDAFKKQTDQLVRDIESNPPAPGFTEVRVPGYRAQRLRAQQLAEGTVEVDDHDWKKFVALHKKLCR